MRMKQNGVLEDSSQDEEFQMSPMIDIVFLLLVYFIMTTTLLRPEADLGIQLPGRVKQKEKIKMPDEQIIEIDAAGNVYLNGQSFDPPTQREMPKLLGTLQRFRQASEDTDTKPMVTIQASDDTQHQRLVDVMNACADAKIKLVSFGMSGE